MQPSNDFPIRLTVCETADSAARLVQELRQAGFTTDEISVVCSEDACEREFAEFVHEHPAGSQVPEALNRSGLAGLGLGASAVVAGLLTSGGAAIMAVGAFAGLAIAGTFVSVMATRGAEKELSDYYDQAITKGKILVAVETEEAARQQLADEILGHEGRVPTAIPEETNG